MSVIQKKLEDGVVEIFTSEKYREYMDAMSKFPRYSVNNCILIASQYPQASLVCGFRKWQKEPWRARASKREERGRKPENSARKEI